MGTFLSIALIVGFGILIYTFLKSPLEIIKNFFKGIFYYFLNVIPFSYLVIGAIKDSRKLKKEKKMVETLFLTKDLVSTRKIEVQKSECFVLINGRVEQELVKIDILNAITNLNKSTRISTELRETGTVHVIKLSNLSKLSDLMQLVSILSEDYGIDNTFGYLRSNNQKAFFQINRDNKSELIGLTEDSQAFFYSLASFESKFDFVIFNDSFFLKPDLNTIFFDHLVNLTYD